MTKPFDQKFNRADKSFDSLQECIAYVQLTYPENTTTKIKVIDIETGERFETFVSAYFYRGEEYAYPTTVSSMQRLNDNAELAKEVKEKFKSVASRIDMELQEFSNLSPMYSAAYLQHYGLPTELLDITSSLEIAAYFASCGKIGDEGLLCVLPTQDIYTQSKIIDLTDHPSAERPRRQFAYGFFHDKFIDLKQADCVSTLKLKWFSFKLTEQDIKKFKVKEEILNAQTDKVAGMIQIIVDDFEKQEDEIAKWLSEKVVPAPFVAKIIDYWEHKPQQPKTVELISIQEAGMAYNADVERENNYKKWSNLHPEVRPHKLKPLVQKYPLE
ncbi:FRG domain-containing protein [Chitinophagaceae bacterium MMS25-I14]